MNRLPLFEQRAPAAVETDRCAAILAIMRASDRKIWTKAQIRVAMGGSLSDRAIRRMLSDSAEVIATSQRAGYQLLERSTAEEIRHAVAELRSRERHLGARAFHIERNAHRCPHVPPDDPSLGGAV